MPWLLLLAAVFGGLALLMFAATRRSEDVDHRAAGRGALILGLPLALLLLVLASTTIVSTRNVGVVTSFGKPVGTLSNGLHVIWPWQKVPELSGTIQTDSHTGGFDTSGKCDGGTPVRLANNSTACVDNTVRWRIVPAAGDALFRDYQNDGNIRDSLVTRELNAVLNAVFAEYNPLSPQAADGPNLTQLSDAVTVKLREKVGAQIEVQNVIVQIVHFDGQTQEKINNYQAQIANTRIAEESQKTAAAQAEANRALASSVSNDPYVLVARCLELVNMGKQLPVGFQCWPGNGLPVTIPAR